MTRINNTLENKVLDNLGYIKERLHYKEVNYNDSLWMVNTINMLLLDRYFTKSRLEEED